MLVMKFGGTSVADADRLRAVADLVASTPGSSPVVVVSAMAGVTDALLDGVELALGGGAEPQLPSSVTMSTSVRTTVLRLAPPTRSFISS